MLKRLNLKGLIQIKSLTEMNILIVYFWLCICCFQLQNVLKTIHLKAKILFTTFFVRSCANTGKLSTSVSSSGFKLQVCPTADKGAVRVVSREQTCRKLYFHIWLVGWLCSWTDRPQMWHLGNTTAWRHDGGSLYGCTAVYRCFYETSEVLLFSNYTQ